MLMNFLEANIQNKLKIFSLLHAHPSICIKELSHFLNLGYSGIDTLIKELNADFNGLAEIRKKAAYFSIHIYANDDLSKLLQTIYKKSNVLRCLKFMITNDSGISFSEFIEHEFLTKSSAYRIRQSCLDYLHKIGLAVKDNKVIGEEYRIRFLIALLYYKYGIDCCDIDEQSIHFARNYILSTNKKIDLNYLETTSNVYGYFECLLILLWKRKNDPVSFPENDNFKKFKELSFYEKIKTSIKETIEPALQVEFSEADYDYVYLAYCCADNCIFTDRWCEEDMKQAKKIIFSDEVFYDLLSRFGSIFGKEVQNSLALRAALIYFYQKCFLDLQCIIPDEHIYIGVEKSQMSLTLLNLLTDILTSWREKNHIKYQIDDSHLYCLSLQIEVILRQFMKPVQILIVSSLVVDLEIIRLYLSRSFSEKRIKITPIILNEQNRKILYSKKNNIVIVEEKFKQAINSSEFTENNIILPVTIEMNEHEMNEIRQAIVTCEKEIFLDFINSK